MYRYPMQGMVLLFCVGLLLLLGRGGIAHAQTPAEPATLPVPILPDKYTEIYGDGSLPQPYQPAIHSAAQRDYDIMRQGNDSNCEYIAVRNGIQNTGGSGDQAYWVARELVPQAPRDFRESYYTLLGPNGSDQPFTPDNLGAAPEAFVGVYEALGYNVVSMATTPGVADTHFAHAIYKRLAADPQKTFAHIWITPDQFNPRARTMVVEETGERVDLPYPYHEVVALAAPGQESHIIILDGLVGHPYTISLAEMAHKLKDFNRVIVASRSDSSLEDHQRFQITQPGQPYVDHPLGGIYLRTARQLWGSSYLTWGMMIAPPFRAIDEYGEKTTAFSDYVQYDRHVAERVDLAPLGLLMAHHLTQTAVIPPAVLLGEGAPPLVAGQRQWVTGEFGSVDRFYRVFGQPVTGEFVVSAQQMHHAILDGRPHPLVDLADATNYVCTITERALIAWHPQHGFFLVPLGRIFYERMKGELIGS